ARRGRGVGGGLRLLRLPRGALLLASGGVVLLFVGEHLCGQAPLIPDRGGGVADRAGPVAGIRDDVLLVGTGVVGHPGVLGRGPAGRARRARMHVTARIRDEEGPVPAAPDPERLLEPVNLFPGTLRLLTGRLSVTQGLAESRPGRLGRSSAIGQGHPFAGRLDHLLIALAPGTILLPVADGPMQRVEGPPLAREGRRQLARCRLGMIVELDGLRSAHIEPEPPHQCRTGSIFRSRVGVDLDVSLAASDRPEFTLVALLPRVLLPHAHRCWLPPALGCLPTEVGGAEMRPDAQGRWTARAAVIATGAPLPRSGGMPPGLPLRGEAACSPLGSPPWTCRPSCRWSTSSASCRSRSLRPMPSCAPATSKRSRWVAAASGGSALMSWRRISRGAMRNPIVRRAAQRNNGR